MDILHNLLLGFGAALSLQNLFFCLVGCLLGTLIGVLPGIGPVATIAMLLPITYGLPPLAALIMLAGIYYGAQYGGSTTAILVNMPGETSSVVTCLDGYQMARQGRAGPALAIAAIGSFFAGCVGTLFVAALAPALALLTTKFTSVEYFSLMVLGLLSAVVMAQGSTHQGRRHDLRRPAVRPRRHRREYRHRALHLRRLRIVRRHRLPAGGDGPVRHQRGDEQSGSAASRARL